jgi:hypothetical protein
VSIEDRPTSPPSPATDRNLIFGLLALQMDFVTREQWLDARHAWMLAKQTPLGEILHQRQVLDVLAKGGDQAEYPIPFERVDQNQQRHYRPEGGHEWSEPPFWGGPESSQSLIGTRDWTYVTLIFHSGTRKEIEVGPAGASRQHGYRKGLVRRPRSGRDHRRSAGEEPQTR